MKLASAVSRACCLPILLAACTPGLDEGATSAFTASATSDGDPTECPPNYDVLTSFSVDFSDWPEPPAQWEVVGWECTTTQAEQQGLGQVYAFECLTSAGEPGEIRVTFAPLGAYEPPIAVGQEVTLWFEGGDVGANSRGPRPLGLGYSDEAIAIQGEDGLLVGGAKGGMAGDPIFWGPMTLRLASACGEPTGGEDFGGILHVDESEVLGSVAVSVDPGESVVYESVLGERYRVDLGRLVGNEAAWGIDFVITRM